jgi:hypothetical protein
MQLNLQGWRPSKEAHGAASIAPCQGIKNPGGSPFELIPRGLINYRAGDALPTAAAWTMRLTAEVAG